MPNTKHPDETPGILPHPPGSRIITRTVTKGKIRYATCAYTVRDSETEIAYYLPENRSYSKVTKGTRVTPRSDRELALRGELLTGEWELIDNKPSTPSQVIWSAPGQWFSVALKPLGENGDLIPCYVNFQRPLCRTRVGFDGDDLCLDLVLSSSSDSWEIKDAKDYEERIELGLYSTEEQEGVKDAKNRALDLISSGTAPFDGSWNAWRAEVDWVDYPFPGNWDEFT